MQTLSRASYILSVISKVGKVSVHELSEELDVSLETIRRDLKRLDDKGELIRVHGGAVCKEYKDEGTSFNKRASNNIDDKKHLVEKALSYIYKGAVIGLDASSSSWHVAQAMPDIECTVVTNSVNNINVLSGKRNITIICLGGFYSEKYKAFYGMLTKNALSEMSLDLCFISCSGFEEAGSVWDSNEYNYDIKGEFIKSSETSILLADKSKRNKKSLLKICDFTDLDILISNS